MKRAQRRTAPGPAPAALGRAPLVMLTIALTFASSAALYAVSRTSAASALLALGLGAAVTLISLRERRIEWRLLTLDRNMKRRASRPSESVVGKEPPTRNASAPASKVTGLSPRKTAAAEDPLPSTAKPVGRQAAQSPVSTSREALLESVVEGWNLETKRDAVAAILSANRRPRPNPEWLNALIPGISVPTLERTSPRAIVIDEDAFTEGIWYGAHSTAGEHLFAELCAVRAWGARNKVPVFGIKSSTSLGTNSGAIRALFTDFLPVLPPGEVPDGIPVPLFIRRMESFLSNHANAAVTSKEVQVP